MTEVIFTLKDNRVYRNGVDVGAISHYKATGTLCNGKRFKAITTTNLSHVLGLNLYRGTKWIVTDDGKCHPFRRVYN